MAASTAAPATTTETLPDIGQPPPDTIVPPYDIQSIIEKTAGFVVRNGVSFEDRVRQKENNSKFSFLTPDDPYRTYYLWRMDEIRAGRGTDMSAGRAANDAATAVAQQQRQVDKGPKKPADFRFSAKMPQINSKDNEVIKLTALFCARNGRQWQMSLAQKEAGNFQFDFLRPQHSLYQFFMRLQDQYRDLMHPNGRENDWPESKRLAELDHIAQRKTQLVDRAKERAEYVKWETRQRQAKEEEEAKEKMEYAQIDWHDFVVINTVTFTDKDDEEDLPVPTPLSSLQSASLEQKGAMVFGSDRRIEEAMPTADMDFEYSNPPAQQNGHARHTPTQPTPSFSPRPPSVPQQSFSAPPPLETDRMASRDADLDAQNRARAAAMSNAPMNIRKDYQGRAGRQQKAQTMTMCPNCHQEMLFSELSEHLRIEMLDPRWREQRRKEQARNLTTNLSTADVAQNLKRLASQRSDVFDGATGEELSEEEKERRKRAAMGYEGMLSGSDGQGSGNGSGRNGAGVSTPSTNLQEQLRHIHQKAQQH